MKCAYVINFAPRWTPAFHYEKNSLDSFLSKKEKGYVDLTHTFETQLNLAFIHKTHPTTRYLHEQKINAYC